MVNTDKIEFSQAELARYNRHLIMPGFGLDGQKKLKAAKVLVVGSGGLGSPILLYLAAAGVGTIGIIDFDVVDESNLQRQVLFDVNEVGVSKVEAAKQRLEGVKSSHRFQDLQHGSFFRECTGHYQRLRCSCRRH
jgi:adenylyltransferase/sulfurtransferase